VTWNPTELPRREGHTFVVTGANAGLGYFTAEQIARTGAHVVLACRNPVKTDAALAAIRRRVPGAVLSTAQIDVSDLESVRSASAVLGELPRIDGLILNAGIVHPPREREVSVDGNELVFATNFLGHFALTAALLPRLVATPGSRVIALGSMITRLMDSPLSDVQLTSGYNQWKAYAQSKIAMQVFGFELDRRLRATGQGGAQGVQALVAHPGYSISGLTPSIRGVNEPEREKRVSGALQSFAAQGKDRGAWPTVRAVLDPTAVGGEFYGPRFLTQGQPTVQTPTRRSRDTDVAAMLYERAEEFTGDEFPI
jgi:NAD(P)-dependent dehydrogenase (short-subunit alcohol dehydrogenase family)